MLQKSDPAFSGSLMEEEIFEALCLKKVDLSKECIFHLKEWGVAEGFDVWLHLEVIRREHRVTEWTATYNF